MHGKCVIVDQDFGLINVYRCFNPTNGMSAKMFFPYQLGLIEASFTTKTVLLGDFNMPVLYISTSVWSAQRSKRWSKLSKSFDTIQEINRYETINILVA